MLTGRLARLRDRLGKLHPATTSDIPLVWAAVAVLISPDPDSFLLIRRAVRQGDPWSGHMALPGGRREPGDENLLATVIRETREEVGVELVSDHLLGSLDDVIPRTPVLPPIAVRPFVFLAAARPALTLSDEVAAISWVPLDDLLYPGAACTASVPVGGEIREVPAYRVGEAVIWGMTERILTGLVQHLRQASLP